ncbi:toll/interleukin-1 receptor domain-containing protein [Mesorhizobium sp. M0037]
MARCTAPRRGHRTASGRAECPQCGGRGGYGGGYGSSYGSYSRPSYPSFGGGGVSRSSGGGSSSSARPRWSRSGSSVAYTIAEVRALTPIRETVEKRAELPVAPDLRDVFLCHAWADRQEDATELYNLLKALNVSVWFSEKDIPLGSSYLREIDRGLAKSRVGIVLVTPALLLRLPTGGVADRELSALLATDQLVPIIHNTTYEALRNVSPLLASRNGLSTGENSMAEVAAKLAELVAPSL